MESRDTFPWEMWLRMVEKMECYIKEKKQKE